MVFEEENVDADLEYVLPAGILYFVLEFNSCKVLFYMVCSKRKMVPSCKWCLWAYVTEYHLTPQC